MKRRCCFLVGVTSLTTLNWHPNLQLIALPLALSVGYAGLVVSGCEACQPLYHKELQASLTGVCFYKVLAFGCGQYSLQFWSLGPCAVPGLSPSASLGSIARLPYRCERKFPLSSHFCSNGPSPSAKCELFVFFSGCFGAHVVAHDVSHSTNLSFCLIVG